eukprot:g24288.t1
MPEEKDGLVDMVDKPGNQAMQLSVVRKRIKLSNMTVATSTTSNHCARRSVQKNFGMFSHPKKGAARKNFRFLSRIDRILSHFPAFSQGVVVILRPDPVDERKFFQTPIQGGEFASNTFNEARMGCFSSSMKLDREFWATNNEYDYPTMPLPSLSVSSLLSGPMRAPNTAERRASKKRREFRSFSMSSLKERTGRSRRVCKKTKGKRPASIELDDADRMLERQLTIPDDVISQEWESDAVPQSKSKSRLRTRFSGCGRVVRARTDSFTSADGFDEHRARLALASILKNPTGSLSDVRSGPGIGLDRPGSTDSMISPGPSPGLYFGKSKYSEQDSPLQNGRLLEDLMDEETPRLSGMKRFFSRQSKKHNKRNKRRSSSGSSVSSLSSNDGVENGLSDEMLAAYMAQATAQAKSKGKEMEMEKEKDMLCEMDVLNSRADSPSSLLQAKAKSPKNNAIPVASPLIPLAPPLPSLIPLAPPLFASGPDTETGKDCASTRKMKKFHWEVVNTQAGLWAEMQQAKLPQLDLTALEGHFSEEPRARAQSKFGEAPVRTKSNIGEPKSLIDEKRAYNMEITFAKIKISPEDLREAILSLDPNVLHGDTLEALAKFAPTKEEVKLLNEFQGDIATQGFADRFVHTLRDIPNVALRMDLLLFQHQFGTHAVRLEQALNTVQKACEEIRSSAHIKTILFAILQIGNALNSVDASGFRLSSLGRLNSTKSQDKSFNLLHFLVESLKKNHPETLTLAQELGTVKDAACIEQAFLQAELKMFREHLEDLKKELDRPNGKDGQPMSPAKSLFRQRLPAFYASAMERTVALEGKLANLLAYCHQLAVYFGEPELKFQEFFGLWEKFLANFDQCVRELAEREARERRLASRKHHSVTRLKRQKRSGKSKGSDETSKQEKESYRRKSFKRASILGKKASSPLSTNENSQSNQANDFSLLQDCSLTSRKLARRGSSKKKGRPSVSFATTATSPRKSSLKATPLSHINSPRTLR